MALEIKMKIAFINIYQSSIDRGSETLIREVYKRLGRQGHEVTVFGGEDLKINWAKKDMSGTLARRFFVDYWSILIARYTLKVSRKVFKEKYDIVVPLNGGWQTLITRLATLLYGGKMIISAQSGKGWDDRVNLWLMPDCFIATSSKVKAWAKAFNPFVKVEYIPNGVDLDKFNPVGPKYKHGLKSPVILCAAALVTTKHIDTVIHAVSKLSNASLLVVGKGEQYQVLSDLGRKLLKDRFKLVSAKPEQMPGIYRSANVFAFTPYTREAFGIVYVEALASNLPVVGTNDNIRQEIVSDAGILVDNPNPENVSKAIESALNLKWGDKPRQQAMKFSWDIIAKQYEKLFVDLVKK